ncbi:GntR family transcriptional regulator [Niabella aquatica]
MLKNEHLTKVKQIAEIIKSQINQGILREGQQIPSISKYSKNCRVARETVEKAYALLKQEHYITPIAGKGFFVNYLSERKPMVLLIAERFGKCSGLIYDYLAKSLDSKAIIDVVVYYCDLTKLSELLSLNKHRYSFYLFVPEFSCQDYTGEVLDLLKIISSERLVFFSKPVHFPMSDVRFFHNIEKDTYESLSLVAEKVSKYTRIVIINTTNTYPVADIEQGIRRFFLEKNIPVESKRDGMDYMPRQGVLYIIQSDSDLVLLIKKCTLSGWSQGKDIGIISFNDNALKEMLNITVIETDFADMALHAAHCISLGKVQTRRRVNIILRKSV